MKPSVPLFFTLPILVCSVALAGCGGSPQSFHRALAPSPTTGAPPAQPSPVGGTPNALANTPPVSAPQPVPVAPAPAQPVPPAPAPVSAPQPVASANTPIAHQNDGGRDLPSVPDDAEVFDQIQSTSGNWSSCSDCAMGLHTTDNYWMARDVGSPSMSGSSREIYVGGPQWTNALFIKTLPARNDARHFLWDFWVYFDPTSAARAWTAEYDLWQSIGGHEFMIGSQCNFGEGWWDTFDSKANQWVHTTIRCERFEPEEWHHIQWYVERPDDDHYRYVTLVVDGKSYWIDQTYEVNPINWRDAMGVQWQLDQDETGHDLHEWIDNVKLSIW